MLASVEPSRYLVTCTYRATFKRRNTLRTVFSATARLLKVPAVSNMTRSPSSVSHINEHPPEPFSSKAFLTEEATSPNIITVSMFIWTILFGCTRVAVAAPNNSCRARSATVDGLLTALVRAARPVSTVGGLDKREVGGRREDKAPTA